MRNYERDEVGILRKLFWKWMRYERRYLGQVLNNQDPESLGRCRISVPEIGWMVESDSAWVPPVTRHAMSIPEKGAWVLVSFLGGDMKRPIYEGQATWMNDPSPNRPQAFDGVATTRVLFQDPDGGLTISYDAKQKATLVANYGTLTFGGGTEAFALATTLATYLGNLKTWADSHVHTSAASGSPTTPPTVGSPSVPTIKSTKILGE